MRKQLLIIVISLCILSFSKSAEFNESQVKESLSLLSISSNWVINRILTKIKNNMQSSVDFQLGIFAEVNYNERTITDHNEYEVCLQPDEELHQLTQNLIKSVMELSPETMTFNEYHSKISEVIPPFAEAFGKRFVINCPGSEQYVKSRVDFLMNVATYYDDEIRNNWDALRPLLQAYVTAFQDAIQNKRFKHAIAEGLLAAFN